MAMYLGECPVYTVMLIGRWSSDAFLRYIQKQVMEFSHNVSKKMLKFQNYRHIPNFAHQINKNDPRVRNDPNNTASTATIICAIQLICAIVKKSKRHLQRNVRVMNQE
jgi:hypothetical protein